MSEKILLLLLPYKTIFCQHTRRQSVKVSSRSHNSNFTDSRMSSDSNNSDRSWPPRDREDPAEWSQSEESDSRETPYADTPSEASDSDSEASLLNFIGELVDDVMEEDEEAHREGLDQHAPRDFISEMMDVAEDGSNENNETNVRVRRVPPPHLHKLQLDSEGETERSSTMADKSESESDMDTVTTE